MRLTRAPSGRGGILLEVVLAVAILAGATVAMVHAVASSRGVASIVNARARLMGGRVRHIAALCRERGPLHGAQPVRVPRGPGSLTVESWHVQGDDETFVFVRFPPDTARCAVCGLPGTKRWLP